MDVKKMVEDCGLDSLLSGQGQGTGCYEYIVGFHQKQGMS
jgi:hypothetical protein